MTYYDAREKNAERSLVSCSVKKCERLSETSRWSFVSVMTHSCSNTFAVCRLRTTPHR